MAKLKLKCADIYSLNFKDNKKLTEAIKIYEDVAYNYLGINLMWFHAKNIFFKCSLLFLLMKDDIGAEK